jgi:hypothetical protein
VYCREAGEITVITFTFGLSCFLGAFDVLHIAFEDGVLLELCEESGGFTNFQIMNNLPEPVSLNGY